MQVRLEVDWKPRLAVLPVDVLAGGIFSRPNFEHSQDYHESVRYETGLQMRCWLSGQNLDLQRAEDSVATAFVENSRIRSCQSRQRSRQPGIINQQKSREAWLLVNTAEAGELREMGERSDVELRTPPGVWTSVPSSNSVDRDIHYGWDTLYRTVTTSMRPKPAFRHLVEVDSIESGDGLEDVQCGRRLDS